MHAVGATWDTRAPRGCSAHPYRHRLAGIGSFGHITSAAPRVIVLGGGNTAMDCCRSARRLAEDVKVIVRSGFDEMKASPWEKRTPSTKAFHPELHVPKTFEHDNGRLTGMTFEIVQGRVRRQGPAQPGAHRRARCVRGV